MTKAPDRSSILWWTVRFALAASWLHLATWFVRFEELGHTATVLGWQVDLAYIPAGLAATIADLGIYALIRSIPDASDPDRIRSIVRWLMAVSCLANVEHAVAGWLANNPGAIGSWPGLSLAAPAWLGSWAWVLANAFLVAGMLPVIVSLVTDRIPAGAAAREAVGAPATDNGSATRQPGQPKPARPAQERPAGGPEALRELVRASGGRVASADAEAHFGVSNSTVDRWLRAGGLAWDRGHVVASRQT